MIGQLELRDDEGQLTVLGTDESWLAGRGPVLSADLYNGETYDARLAASGLGGRPSGTDLEPVVAEDFDAALLVAPDGPPVRATEELPVQAVLTTPSGKTILDFGQNLVGHVRISVRGEAGTEVVLRHAEVLEHGELGVRPLRTARQTDTYILRGSGTEEQYWLPNSPFTASATSR